MRYKDLSPELCAMAVANQVAQGNPADDTRAVCNTKLNKGFDWTDSFEGNSFWSDIFNGKTPEMPKEYIYEIY